MSFENSVIVQAVTEFFYTHKEVRIWKPVVIVITKTSYQNEKDKQEDITMIRTTYTNKKRNFSMDAVKNILDTASKATASVKSKDSETAYFETSVFSHAASRIPWLLVLMFTSIITGNIISKYENAFATIPLLVSFIPMLMDTGGNCGSQSSTLIIRGIAVDEIHFSDIFRVMFKEFRISLIVGAALAVSNGLRIWIQYKNPKLALVIAASLICTVMASKLVGCILPLAAKKLHFDPAIMASPLITTVVDTFSILIYFNIATMLFQL